MQDQEGNKVQERIKRMMKQKKKAKQNHSLTQLQKRKRAISQTLLQSSQNSLSRRENVEQDLSIRTQWRKRVNGSQKYSETQNSQVTSINQTSYPQTNQIDVEKIVHTIFYNSSKIAQFCVQCNSKKQEVMRQILASELFVTSLGNKISRLSNQENEAFRGQLSQSISPTMNAILENEIILKLTKLNRKKKISLSYFDVQNRIKSMISKRLDLLNKY